MRGGRRRRPARTFALVFSCIAVSRSETVTARNDRNGAGVPLIHRSRAAGGAPAHSLEKVLTRCEPQMARLPLSSREAPDNPEWLEQGEKHGASIVSGDGMQPGKGNEMWIPGMDVMHAPVVHCQFPALRDASNAAVEAEKQGTPITKHLATALSAAARQCAVLNDSAIGIVTSLTTDGLPFQSATVDATALWEEIEASLQRFVQKGVCEPILCNTAVTKIQRDLSCSALQARRRVATSAKIGSLSLQENYQHPE
jgi:hypothetical protein